MVEHNLIESTPIGTVSLLCPPYWVSLMKGEFEVFNIYYYFMSAQTIMNLCCIVQAAYGIYTCQPVRLKILEIQFFWTLRSHSSKLWPPTPTADPCPPTASILSYLSSAQQDLAAEPQENIRKPLITISALNYDTLNTGDLTGMMVSSPFSSVL